MLPERLMAVVDDDEKPGGSGGFDKEPAKFKKVSLDDAGVEGVAASYDAEDDPYARIAPPPKQVVGFKLFANRDGWKQYEDGNFGIGLEAKIVEWLGVPECAQTHKGYIVQHNMSTMIRKGKKTSDIAHLLVRLVGSQVKVDDINTKKLAQYMAQVLKKEPLVYGLLDWKGTYKDGKEWETPFWTMDDFPKDEEGNPNPNPWIDGHKVLCVPRIAVIYGKKEHWEAAKLNEEPKKAAPKKAKAQKEETAIKDDDFADLKL